MKIDPNEVEHISGGRPAASEARWHGGASLPSSGKDAEYKGAKYAKAS